MFNTTPAYTLYCKEHRLYVSGVDHNHLNFLDKGACVWFNKSSAKEVLETLKASELLFLGMRGRYCNRTPLSIKEVLCEVSPKPEGSFLHKEAILKEDYVLNWTDSGDMIYTVVSNSGGSKFYNHSGCLQGKWDLVSKSSIQMATFYSYQDALLVYHRAVFMGETDIEIKKLKASLQPRKDSLSYNQARFIILE